MSLLNSANKELYKVHAEEFGQSHKRESIIYTRWAQVRFLVMPMAFAVCLLQEMQWVHSSPIHSGGILPRPLSKLPIMMYLSCSSKRLGMFGNSMKGLINSSSAIANRVTVVDAEEFEWKGIKNDLKEYFA